MIAFLDEEAGVDMVADLLHQAEEGKADIYMNAIQVIEVYYDRIRVKGIEYADTLLEGLYSSAVKIVHQISQAHIHEAGRFKTSYKLSFADAIACAEAFSIPATLVTADHGELGPVESREPFPFLWIR
jgi:predicted nucleic acid-binding protein